MPIIFRPLLISLFITSTALATTWTVDDDGKADFENIQAAVDAASDGDEIIVMPGTYTSTQDGHVVNMLGKAVTLRSSDPRDSDVVAATVIDGENTRRGLACFNGETNKTVIDGFTFTNGYSAGYDYEGDGDIDWWEEGGGGVLSFYTDPTVKNCSLIDNNGERGAGMFCFFSVAVLDNCSFINNAASTHGGGLYWGYSSNSMISICLFENNISSAGGGGYYNGYSNKTIENCTFRNNNSGYGGGLRAHSLNPSEFPTVVSSFFCSNSPDQIAGDYIDGGGNTLAEECPDCPDINGDGYVNVSDLLAIIDQWGLTDSPADVNEDGIVDVSDLLIVVGNWGPCE